MKIINALCIDLDDLAFSFMEGGSKLKNPQYLAEEESSDLLEYLNFHKIRATFFIPGIIVKNSLGLIKKIAAQGHEIAAHGRYHIPVYRYEPHQFSEDIRWIKNRLEDAAGTEIDTYKAPLWSITPKCIWAYDLLMEAGYKVDHTAMSAVKKHFHIQPDSIAPFYYKNHLLVIPPTVLKIGFTDLVIPFFGGFYNAYYPFWFQKKVFNKFNRKNLPFNLYLHPFEYSPRGMNSRKYKYNLRISSYAFHSGKYGFLLPELLKEFNFASLKTAYQTDSLNRREEYVEYPRYYRL